MVARRLLDRAGLKADEGHGGAVTLIQRFGSADIHLHCRVLDGVYRCGDDGPPVFIEVDAPTDDDDPLGLFEPAEPNQNAYSERCNRTHRHEAIDACLFTSIEQVQHITEEWLLEYNEQRPHDALGGLPPRQFLPRLTTVADSRNGLSA